MDSSSFERSNGQSTFKAHHANYNEGRFHPYRKTGSGENHRGRGRGRWNGNRGGSRGKRNFQGRPGGGKSWVNGDLRQILQERDKLYQKAMETQDPEDWNKYNSVEKTASELMSKVAVVSAPFERKTSGGLFSCDTCDRSFPTEEGQKEHFAEHVTCNLDGCTFTAHPKILLKHIEMQHSNNLFKRINAAKDPEDIKLWIEERKANYPTSQNRERKAQEMEERFNRGERIPMSYMRKRQYDQSIAKDKAERVSQTDTNEQSNTKIGCTSFAGVSDITTDKLKLEASEKSESKSIESKEFNQHEHRPRKARQPFLYSDEKQKHLSKADVPEIVTLDNFYSKVRVIGNTKLLGKNMISWNAITLKVSNEIASTGLGMKYLMCSMNIHIDSEDENLDSTADPYITDDEDDWGLSGDDSKDYVAASDSNDGANANQNASSSIPVGSALGLVAYSDDSDSEGEAPEEISNSQQAEPVELKSLSAPKIHIVSKATGVMENEAALECPENLAVQSLSIEPEVKLIAKKSDEKKRNKTGRAGKNVQKLKKTIAAKRRPKMSRFLNKLLGDDIRRERNQILQVCRFICQKNFFEESKHQPDAKVQDGFPVVDSDSKVTTPPFNLDAKLMVPESTDTEEPLDYNPIKSESNPVCELAAIITQCNSMRTMSESISSYNNSNHIEDMEVQAPTI